ncbi:MAG: hypothetical protein R3F37_11615 [Candidatus Competibacteraceae bacterium]
MFFNWLIPGPVVGMLLLFGILMVQGHIPESWIKPLQPCSII